MGYAQQKAEHLVNTIGKQEAIAQTLREIEFLEKVINNSKTSEELENNKNRRNLEQAVLAILNTQY